MGGSRVFQVVYSFRLCKPGTSLEIKPTEKDWGTHYAPCCAPLNFYPSFSHPKSDVSEERASLATVSAPFLSHLWNKGYVRDLYLTCSAHPCLSQNSLWAGLSQLVMWPHEQRQQSNSLMGRAQGSSHRVGTATKETNYLMKDSRSLIHRMWAFTCLTWVLTC